MRIATTIFATVAGLTVALTLSGLHGTAAAQSLPGYSAHPEGMCWTRETGNGQDIAGGHWAACPKTAGNAKARTAPQPAPGELRASAAQHLPSHGSATAASEPIYFGLAATGTDE